MVAAAAVFATACSSVTPYAATVDGQRITSDDLENELRAIASNEAYVRLIGQERDLVVEGTGSGNFDASIAAFTLTRQIYYLLVEAELAERKISVSTDDLNQSRTDLKSQFAGDPTLFDKFPADYQTTLVRREAELARLGRAVSDVKSVEDAARAYYDNNQGDFTQACVRHILVGTAEVAQGLARRLDEGAVFEELAKSDSADTGSAAQGGLVACDVTPKSPYVPEFLNAVFSQQIGQVGAPVATQFGVHLIRVDSRKVLSYDEAADQAKREIERGNERQVQDLLRDVIGQAKIDVNPRYGRFNPETSQVEPQLAPDPPAGVDPDGGVSPDAGVAPDGGPSGASPPDPATP